MVKNILFIDQFANIGGGQKVLLQTIGALDRNKYEPMVCLPSLGELSDRLKSMSIKTLFLPIGNYSAGKKNVFDLLNYFTRGAILLPLTMFLIKKNKIKLLYLNGPRTFLWGTIAANLMGVPVIWHLHSILRGAEKNVCVRILEKHVDKILAVSQAVKNSLGPSNKNIVIIYNCVNEIVNASVRERHLNNDSTKIIGYIGQLAKWKGIEDYIQAAAIVARSIKNIEFWIIGDALFDNKREKQYKTKLINMVREVNLTGKIIFKGRIKEINEIMPNLDIVIVPSIETEPFSLAMIESMGAEKIVIASNHGGPSEIIKNNITGLLFTPGNYKELAGKITDVIINPNKYKTMGQAAGKEIKDNYNYQIYCQGINATIEEVIGYKKKSS